eukprot:42249-Chlamydomonas_euryale.AAC.2
MAGKYTDRHRRLTPLRILFILFEASVNETVNKEEEVHRRGPLQDAMARPARALPDTPRLLTGAGPPARPRPLQRRRKVRPSAQAAQACSGMHRRHMH